MAPRERKPRENQFLFNLGVKGRKTGLELPDTGIRDENGLEPMDHLFSSPEKPQGRSTKKSVNGTRKNVNATISEEESMDMGDGSPPEPIAVLSARRSTMRLPPPRSNSPIKTSLQSPARRKPTLASGSSPTRGSIPSRESAATAHVRRKLVFSQNSLEDQEEDDSTQSAPQKLKGFALPKVGKGKLSNGHRLAPAMHTDSSDDDIQEGGNDSTGIDNILDDMEDSYQMVNGGDDEDIEPETEGPEQISEAEPEHELQPSKNKKAKGKEVAQAGLKRGRENKKNVDVPEEELEPEPEPEQRPAKRTRRSLNTAEPIKKARGRPKKVPPPEEEPKDVEAPEEGEPEQVVEVPKKKPGRSKSGAPSAAAKVAKSKGQKTKLATIPESDSPQIQRGPPLPRRNNGLFILRRETPVGDAGFKTTRSGRNSIKPLAFWRNERVEYNFTEEADDGNHGRKMPLYGIKEVVRAEEVAEPKKKKNYSRAKNRARAEPESEEEEVELEPWETEPGQIVGDVLEWDSEAQVGQVGEREEELALSSAAIITRDIAGATFRFAKTLTRPFFGSGVVDLPPKSIKKPKNARKMQMAFFVFYGRVKVTVNDTDFRISKGGMFQVPRGNFYSIENDYDAPARLFFSQGCEVVVAAGIQ